MARPRTQGGTTAGATCGSRGSRGATAGAARALRAARRGAGAQRGVTLIETAVATLVTALLAGALAGAAEVVLAVDREARRAAEVGELGLGLLAEIAALPFADPQTGSGALGPDGGEWPAAQTRALFDDVDDYTVGDGTRVLQQKDGTPIDLRRYRRVVTVIYLDSQDPVSPSAGETDYKLITVTVLEGAEVAGVFRTVRVRGGRDVDYAG